ncbi:hypothetical protein PSTG_05611 [Puccinia striiformis f. sp. tritici PST-78]|uniref:Uncharacterized protein n=1 Tax=Puccinia striiformis f. sp. tritici PST-78 TaxID=1165861 RepID=A0A0L0VPP5_9BASI|nr:hypothetical protein PSTG_05611 [Puccinia striiformis f. sp. tritici PST-78]
MSRDNTKLFGPTMTHAMTSLMTKGLSLMITSSATNLTLSKDMERVILILKHLINNIQAVNGGAEPPPPLGSLSGLLNISNKAPDYMNETLKDLHEDAQGRQAGFVMSVKCLTRLMGL